MAIALNEMDKGAANAAALCGTGALLIYGPVAAVCVVTLLICSLFWVRPVTTWLRMVALFALWAAIAVPGLFEVVQPIGRALLLERQAPVFWREASASGNLLGFLNPLELAGLWFDPDYRFFDGASSGLRDPAHLGRRHGCWCGPARPGISRSEAHGPRGGPVGGRRAGDRLRHAKPLQHLQDDDAALPAGASHHHCRPGGRAPSASGSSAAGRVHCVGDAHSTALGVSRLPVLPGKVLSAMSQVAQRISGKAALVYSEDDWLLYDVDSKLIDITGLHYRADEFDRERARTAPYQVIVFEGQRPEADGFACERREKIGRFRLCYR